MYDALSKREISFFLECSEDRVEELWKSNRLRQRRTSDPSATSPEIYSHVGDVLEYSLSSGEIGAPVEKSNAGHWVSATMAAACTPAWRSGEIDERVILVIDSLHPSVSSTPCERSVRIAATLCIAYEALVSIAVVGLASKLRPSHL